MGNNKSRQEAQRRGFPRSRHDGGRSESNRDRGECLKSQEVQKREGDDTYGRRETKRMGEETTMRHANELNRSDKDEIDIGKSEEKEKELQKEKLR